MDQCRCRDASVSTIGGRSRAEQGWSPVRSLGSMAPFVRRERLLIHVVHVLYRRSDKAPRQSSTSNGLDSTFTQIWRCRYPLGSLAELWEKLQRNECSTGGPADFRQACGAFQRYFGRQSEVRAQWTYISSAVGRPRRLHQVSRCRCAAAVAGNLQCCHSRSLRSFARCAIICICPAPCNLSTSS